jgi:hypothetical protein
MAVSKATIVEDIYDEFYDLVSTITNFDVYPAFPRKDITSKSTYPVMILNSPELSWDTFTLTKKKANGTISFDIFTTSAKTCDEYTSDAIDKIETSRKILRDAGLKFVVLDDTSKDVLIRGKITVHVKTITFSYQFIFTKTQSY